MSTAQYWDDRALRQGHTGWSDWLIYEFDQLAREKAIRGVLSKIGANRRKAKAIDLGTGTGDFARVLAGTYSEVVAVDISEKVLEIARRINARTKNIRFVHPDALSQEDTRDADLVLSVTVLNHIMDDAALQATIESLGKGLSADGYFIAFEYCASKAAAVSSYQRNMTFEEWRTLFARCGLSLHDCYGFYHPNLDRCRSFDRYSGSFIVRLLRRVGRSPLSARALRLAAAFFQFGREDYFWRGKPTDTLRVMVFRKSPQAGEAIASAPAPHMENAGVAA